MANSPGDFTGKEKARLAAENAEEQQRRAAEMSMITAAAETNKTREVVDYTQPKQAPPPEDTGPIDLTEATEPSGDDDIDAIVDATREDAPEAPVQREVTPVVQHRVERTSVLVRARYDMPAVTVGHGTNYDFEEGRQYRVPPNVANHLNERALVDILQ
jgi:hypothetical protein